AVSLDGTVVDVTDRKRAEAERERLLTELEVERGKLRTLFQLAPAFIAVLQGPDLVFEYVNDAYYGIVGHRPLLGRPLAEALPEAVGGEAGQDYDRLLREIIDEGKPRTFSERPVMLQRTPEGPVEERLIDLAYQPLHEADGTVSGILAHGIDVTDSVRARQEVLDLAESLKRQTRLWDAALSHIADNVWVFDEEVRFQYANQTLLGLWGLPIEAVLGKNCEELDYEPAVSTQLRRDTNRVFETGQPVPGSVDYTSPTGQSGMFEYVMTPVFGMDGHVDLVAGSSRDVTERARADAALRTSEERLRQLVELSPSTVWFGENDGGLSYISGDFYAMTGL
ncbi:PAS domain S-box protein, partial [bacterium]